jgi:hypothetical protein
MRQFTDNRAAPDMQTVARKTKLSKQQLVLEITRMVRHYEMRRMERLSLLDRLREIFTGQPAKSEMLKHLHYLDLNSLRHHHHKLMRTLRPPSRGRPPNPDYDLVFEVDELIAKHGLSLQMACNSVAKSRGDKETGADALRKRYKSAAGNLNKKRKPIINSNNS